MEINELAEDIHRTAVEHGWWNGIRTMAEILMNIHAEVSELWESFRKGTLKDQCDKKDTGLTNLEEELADIIIRALDVMIAEGIDPEVVIASKMSYNQNRPYRHGGLKA
jgi:NTP pyrophosphatase (non-canonical NTP hydrolase)